MRELEARFFDTLAVVGVHSPKFPTERESGHLRAAIQRLEIDHPVINDRAFEVWNAYTVRAWPTLMFLDPEGRVIGKHEGEFALDDMLAVVQGMLDEFDRAGLLLRTPIPARVDLPRPTTPLAFPGDVVADEASGWLWIADSNHNRIVVTEFSGELVQTIGAGAPGFDDGPAHLATFNRPQGLTLHEGALYVADTENHAIRRVDIASSQTTTIAGTGEQARQYISGGPALETPLTSPWNVAVVNGMLYIAMAGNHQLWMLPLDGDEVRRFAGSGHEGLRDGKLAGAWLAQPSGIGRYGSRPALVFTDSETSSVRVADLPGAGQDEVRTLAGEDLFEFGDIDGPPDVARLQHPLGVVCDPASGVVYVADTYNSKIKRIDPASGRVETWLGGEVSGNVGGIGAAARFNEPAGVSLAAGALWIADTNNHAIRRADLATGAVTTVEILGLEPPG